MIKGIQKIKNLGIFSDYARPSGIENFAEKNIIYGWNYSGKTTLSRLFQILEKRELHPDYKLAKFTIENSAGITITETNFSSNGETIRVFNADFIEKNLSWNGMVFNPILLLGEESIDAEKQITKYKELLTKCRERYRAKSEKIAAIEAAIATEKTTTAKKIKTTLSLVEAFNATHLNTLLETVCTSPEKFKIDDSELPNLLKLALTSVRDKLNTIPLLNIKTKLQLLEEDAKALLTKQPEFANTIQHLQEHPEVSNWIETGLTLHEHTSNCEFCGNEILPERINELRAHFSKDLLNHKKDVEEFIKKLEPQKLSMGEISQEKVTCPIFSGQVNLE